MKHAAKVKRLSVRAPHRMSVENAGTFHTVSWTLEAIREYREKAGGFFETGQHDFDCKQTALEATA